VIFHFFSFDQNAKKINWTALYF